MNLFDIENNYKIFEDNELKYWILKKKWYKKNFNPSTDEIITGPLKTYRQAEYILNAILKDEKSTLNSINISFLIILMVFFVMPSILIAIFNPVFFLFIAIIIIFGITYAYKEHYK